MYIDMIELKKSVQNNPIIAVGVFCVLFIGLILLISWNSEEPKPKKYTPPVQKVFDEVEKPQIIVHNLICQGNGELIVEFNENKETYDVEGIRDFELNVEENTDIKIHWKSDGDMKISLTGKNVEKDIKCKSGDLVINVGPRNDCFINSIR